MSDVGNAVNNKTIKTVFVAESNKKEKVVVPESIPQKMKLNVDAQSNNIYETDIESFVSNCIPGVCFNKQPKKKHKD